MRKVTIIINTFKYSLNESNLLIIDDQSKIVICIFNNLKETLKIIIKTQKQNIVQPFVSLLLTEIK